MKKKVVAVLFGGASSEHEVSMRSAANVIPAIPLDAYHVLPIYINKEGKWFLYDGSLDNFENILWEKFGTPAILSPDAMQKCLLRMVGDKFKLVPIDMVFSLIHGETGEDGSMQGLCRLANLPIAGCGLTSSALTMDKVFTKAIIEKTAIKQATYLTFKEMAHFSSETWAKMLTDIRYKIGYPCFVKPANTGSSVGISKATNKKTLEAAIREAMKFDRKILVETAIVGRELEVAIIGNTQLTASPVGEILMDGGFYDYDSKYIKEAPTTTSPDLPPGIEEKLQSAAKTIFSALDCRGYARVDFFLEDVTHEIVFNEINTIPGFTSISMFAQLLMKTGKSFSDIVTDILELAWTDFYE